MKRTIFSLSAAILLLFTACEEFLDTRNYDKKDTSNFPLYQSDAEQLIVGIYNNITSSFEDVEQNPIFVSYLASDEALGGGSTSNIIAQSFDRLMATKIDEFSTIWSTCYKGIFRSNNAIETIPNVPDKEWDDLGHRDHLIGEAHFMRAFFYWELIDLFEKVPLVIASAPNNLPNAEPDALFARITSDLMTAIKLMDNKKYGQFDKGRCSKWAAQAYLARIFLFYTGFYKKDALPTIDGGSVNKQEVIKQLEDCISNSGFALLGDPRNIWPYTNEYTKWHYKYTIDNNLKWEGNGCRETLWNIRFNLLSGQQNRIPEFFGVRYQSGGTTGRESFPFGQGYTNGTINPKFVDEWKNDPLYGEKDIRLWGSVFDTRVEIPKHMGDNTKEVERTFLHAKKYIVITCFSSQNSNPERDTPYNNYTYIFTKTNNSYQYGNRDDIIFMRFADVLLMHSELTGTVSGINQVRARAGLDPVGAYSLEILQKERKYELAFEGIRWNDLRRWYPDTAGDLIEKAQNGITIKNREKENQTYLQFSGNSFSKRYKETKGFFRIPTTQINLSKENGQEVLKQNPGWTDDDNWMFIALPYQL